MPIFGIFYFSEGLLQDSELVEAPDAVEAVAHASRQWPQLRAEIWSGDKRVAVIGPSPVIRPTMLSH